MARKNNFKNSFDINKEDLGFEEPVEEISLSSAEAKIHGTTVASFSFTGEALTDNRRLKTEASPPTPLVDGEAYTIGRFYKLRYSTAKMLNEIKASHPDVNVYMNTIVDEAIRYYYSFGFKKDIE